MSFTNVFHPSDFSPGDHGAFVHALKIALAAKGELELLHVDEPGINSNWSDFPHVRDTLSHWGHLSATASRESVINLGLQVRKATTHGTEIEKMIVQYIAEDEPDLVVLATHQRSGPSRWLHQIVAEPVARQARVKTLFVPRRVDGFVSSETGRLHLDNILVPVDRHPHPQAAVEAAVALATLLGSSQVHFTLLHVTPNGEMPELKTQEQPGWTWSRTFRDGDAVHEILAYAEASNSDLVVMSTEGRRGFLDALRGSVTERVLRGLRCPLLAVPAN